MNLTAQVKLLPDERQVALLTQTMQYFNDACNYVSKIAFKYKVFRHINLHNLKIVDDITLYYHLRVKYPRLNSMHIELVLRKVANAYQTRITTSKKRKRKWKKSCSFKEMSGIPYNHLISNYQLLVRCGGGVNDISVSTIAGRDKIKFSIGDHQCRLFLNTIPDRNAIKEARLIYRNKMFYLNIPVEQAVSEPVITKDSIGVDLGVSNIATTSYGKIYNGDIIENKRLKYQKHRSSLQKCGTKSAKRKLKQVSGREQRFRKDTNHIISKELVAVAKGTASRIVLEDLTHIREQTTVRKQQRARHHGWSFAQLREFIGYKALMEGVEIKIIDPRYTSQRCSSCGHISRSNRKNQYRFSCTGCGHDAHADYNAACNLAWLGNNDVSGFSKAEATVN